MANKLATLKLLLSYTGPNGDVVSPSPISVTAPFNSETVGTIDVPDATAGSTVLVVPFGAIATECTGALIVNNTANGVNPGVDLGVKINGAAAVSHRIPPGGTLLIAAPAKAAAGPSLTGITLTTEAGQVGDGNIAFWLFGDPS